MNFKPHFLTLSCLLALSFPAYSEEQAVENEEKIAEQFDESEPEVEALVDLEVLGIENKDEEAWDNVEIYLNQIANDYADGSERHQYLVQTAVDKGLRAKGYYNTKYRFTQTPRVGEKPLLTLYVELDEQKVKVDEIDIQLQGEAKSDEAFIQLVQTAPKKGEELSHSTYDSFKSDMEGLAFKRGYFDAHWLYHRLEIYPSEHTADWRLGYDSGDRYYYGNISFSGSQIREDYMQNMLKIQTGEPYLTNDISKMTADYSSSDWFSSVVVEPSLNEENKKVDLEVQVMPRKKNDIEVGLGFETNVGPRLQFNWKKPWLNNRGHSLETRTFISKLEQIFELGYNIPIKEDPLHYYYQISGGIEREDQNDTKSTAATLGFQRFWTHETGWSFSAGIKARYDSFTQANDKHKTLLIYPTASLNRTRTDGNRFPLWGDSQKLTVDWGTRALASDVNFYRIKASSVWIRSLANNHRFLLRGEAGYIHTKNDDFRRIPPALRYFAGGDMSVRGFGYKKIAPKDPINDKLLGGSRLATGTVEYQYQVYPNIWAAAFYDTGLAADQFKSAELHSGAGVGVRWASPIGSVKFDIATPVKAPNNETGVQFYIGLGSEL